MKEDLLLYFLGGWKENVLWSGEKNIVLGVGLEGCVSVVVFLKGVVKV